MNSLLMWNKINHLNEVYMYIDVDLECDKSDSSINYRCCYYSFCEWLRRIIREEKHKKVSLSNSYFNVYSHFLFFGTLTPFYPALLPAHTALLLYTYKYYPFMVSFNLFLLLLFLNRIKWIMFHCVFVCLCLHMCVQ